ncbi:hypothetical protein A7X67_07405 [Clostridium sp. W14A]|nr:hypothetical protein A7X67_07405 [Clostridium sp. W14A]
MRKHKNGGFEKPSFLFAGFAESPRGFSEKTLFTKVCKTVPVHRHAGGNRCAWRGKSPRSRFERLNQLQMF